jgi:hypothetical protein
VKPATPTQRTVTGRETEWASAELVERLEVAQSRAAELRSERDRLLTELRVAQLWVKELALWLDDAQARTGGRALAPPGLALGPRTVAALRRHAEEPVPWRRLAAVSAIVAAPWALLAALVWLVSTLV